MGRHGQTSLQARCARGIKHKAPPSLQPEWQKPLRKKSGPCSSQPTALLTLAATHCRNRRTNDDCLWGKVPPPLTWRLRNKGFSLIGVLAAMIIFSTIMMLIFKINHRMELAIYRPIEATNRLRAHCRQIMRGPTTPKDGITVETKTQNGITFYTVHNGSITFYVIPGRP